ncbi:sensor histidine kinase [Arsenicibacter rosenii]|uniref:histidine kinase n=1 Tax=Arsenicibacter rosenii TaxID=1750698 RepID=A0A1S2VBQ9_9BACT|nr:sensor histidine kinase [Arsenicibacter rosenii]OIN56187.1 hypothetical protein BLX24_26295 [Arsenicibacter rosenii]
MLRIPALLCLLITGGLLQAQSVRIAALTDSLHTYLPEKGDAEKRHWRISELRAAQAKKNTEGVGEACYLLGKFYQGTGEQRIARFWFLQSLRIREKRGPSEDLVKLYIQLSGNYSASSMSEESKQYILMAMNTARKIRTADSTSALKRAYLMMAGLHAIACPQPPVKDSVYQDYKTMNQREFVNPDALVRWPWLSCDSATYYKRLAEQKLRILNVTDSTKSDFFLNMGLNGPQFIRYFETMLRRYPHLKKTVSGLTNQASLAHAYLSTNNTKRAKFLLDDAVMQYHAHRLNAPALLQMIYSNYVVYYRLTGDYQQAFYYQKLAYEYLLTKLKEDRTAAIARLGVVYESEKKDAKIKSQQQLLEATNRALVAEKSLKTSLTGGLAVALALVAVLWYLYRKNRQISRQKAELVKEQSHRVRNNLQVISDLLTLQAARLTDETALKAVSESQLRIQSIQLLHKRLYLQPEHTVDADLSVYIPEVVGQILATYGLRTLSPVYTIHTTWLSADQTLPLGIILTEVVTNACKYAFDGHPAPSLAIRLSEAENHLQLTVQDNGPGLAESPQQKRSYGFRLIDMQVRQLHGQYHFSQDNGAVFTMRFPAHG